MLPLIEKGYHTCCFCRKFHSRQASCHFFGCRHLNSPDSQFCLCKTYHTHLLPSNASKN